MMRNKWLAGAGTRALSPDMLADACKGGFSSGAVRTCSSENNVSTSKTPGESEEAAFRGAPDEDAQQRCGTKCETAGEGAAQARPDEDLCEKTLVCIDGETLMHPIGLGFSAQEHLLLPFVRIASCASDARAQFAQEEVTGALIYSANDMPGLNVAAALKEDYPCKQVFLVSGDESAWLARRAAFAQLDGVVPAKLFYKELLTRHIKAPGQKQDEASLQPAALPESATFQQSAESLQPAAFRQIAAFPQPEELLQPAAFQQLEELPQLVAFPQEPPAEEAYAFPAQAADSFEPLANDTVPLGAVPLGACAPPALLPVEDASAYGDVVPLEVYEADLCDLEEAQGVASEDQLAESIAPGKPPAFYVPVIGASGGVGKSTVAYMAALCAARLGCKTLLVDFDMQFGDLPRFCSEGAAACLEDVAANPETLAQLEAGPDGFCLVGPCSLPEQAEAASSELVRIVQAAAGSFDVVISNGPSYWNDSHMGLLEKAGKILFVIDQRLAALASAQKAFDLCMRCGMAASPFVFLLNKCGRQAQLTYLDVTCAMQGSPCKELPDGGRAVGEYLDTGQAASLLDEKNEFARALFDVMADILPGCTAAKEAKREHRAARLFGRKRRKGDMQCL